MGVTIVGSQEGEFPLVFHYPIIETKTKWSDDWALEPELEFVSCGIQVGSGQSSCQVQRRYGNVKAPYEGNYSPRKAWDLSGVWLRVSMIGLKGPVVVFQGKIDNQARNLTGNADDPSGVQNWVAADGLQLLRRIDIVGSYFLNSDDGTTALVEWIPSMNAKDRRKLLVGNRSASTESSSGVYMYNGVDKNIWTHTQYIRYILAKFVQQVDGPVWTLAGQTKILDGMSDSVEFDTSISVADVLKKLIPVTKAVDYRIVPTKIGFEINVFALIGKEQSVAGVSMPANPNTVEIQKDGQIDLFDVKIVESAERRVDSIRYYGKRIVVCGSMYGSGAGDGSGVGTGSLAKKWTDALDTAYIAGDGSDDSTSNDKARKRDLFRTVYQQYGARAGWDLNKGTWAIRCGLDGKIIAGPAPYQNTIRNTLSWLPLKEAFDYSTTPETDHNLSDQEPEMKAPVAWIYDEDPDEGDPRFVQCDISGVGSIHKPHNDWGIFINASPNHLLALNHWTDAQIETTETEPRYDYDTLVATIAVEGDQRLKLGYDLPDTLKAGDGSTMVLTDEDSELWVLLPNTVVDIDANGSFLNSGSSLRVLRNDATGEGVGGVPRLPMLLAGAIVKYINERMRAQLTFKGFVPWVGLLGSILTVVQQGDTVQRIGAPFTGIEFIAGKSPTTIIKTGYG